MNILVIGGTGLISTAVVQQLVDRGSSVTLLNRGRTAVRVVGDVNILTADRCDRIAFERAILESCPWDCVIDMICSDPMDAVSLAHVCRGRIRQLLFCSTTNVYPKPAERYPVPEEHRLHAAFKNGIDKVQCEHIHREAERNGAYAVTIIRPGHTYGETSTVLHSLGSASSYLDRLRQGQAIIVHGDGNGLWSALHADDVARVFVAAADNSDAFGCTYNATGSEWMTWNQYHARVAQAMDAPPPSLVHIPVDVLVKLAPTRAAQTQRSLQFPGIYSMASAGTNLGVRQQIPFTDGIRRTVRWLEDQGGIEPWDTDPEYDRVIAAWHALASRVEPVEKGHGTG